MINFIVTYLLIGCIWLAIDTSGEILYAYFGKNDDCYEETMEEINELHSCKWTYLTRLILWPIGVTITTVLWTIVLLKKIGAF